MNARRLLTLGAFALASSLFSPSALRAQDDFVVHGFIEQVEPDGRLRVNHHFIIVDDDTEITDRVYRSVKRHELVKGVEVDIVCENSSRGEHARNLVASLVR